MDAGRRTCYDSRVTPPAGPYLLGLDVGSTHVKAALVTTSGRVVHVARAATPTRRLRAGRSGHPPDELLATTDRLLAACVARSDQPIAALGIASMAEAGVLLDRRGRPLGEIIPWDDPRSAAEAAWLERTVGAADLYARTGLRAGAKTSLAKLRWLANERPATVGRAHAWTGVAELVAHTLTGGLGTDASLACRTMAFDVRSGRWDDALLELAGFDSSRMPPILEPEQPVGGLRPEAANRLGLPSGLPVAVAGHDHIVGALGAGIVHPGDALDSMGSAEACLVVTDEPRPDEALRRAGVSVGRHPLGGRGTIIAGLQTAGSLVDWWIDRWIPASASGSPDGGSIGVGDRYAEVRRLVSADPPGPTGVVVLPYLRGRSCPVPDAWAVLEIIGVGPADTPATVAAALIDGAACAVRWIFETIEGLAPPIRSIRLIGGGRRIERWPVAKAALSPWPLSVADTEEATALGAALVGGLAGDAYATVEDMIAAAAPARPLRRPTTRERYERYYRERFLPAAIRARRQPAERPARR